MIDHTGNPVAAISCMPFHKILCPVCLSEDAEPGMTTGIRLAVEFNAELVIADKWAMPPMAFAGDVGSFPTEGLVAFVDDEERALARMVEDCRSAGVERVSSRLVVGAPTAEVLAMLDDDRSIDLVVVGIDDSNRHGGADLDGPIKRVLRRAPCSVLVAHPPSEGVRFENILCPVDLSETSEWATSIACELAAPEGTITLLHVTELSLLAASSPRPDSIHPDSRALELLEHLASSMRAQTRADIATVARVGRPSAEILDELRVGNFDLVVLGAYRPSAHRLGTVTAKLLRRATCSVLLAHPRN